MICKFQIDTIHLPSKIYEMFDYWVGIDVELTKEEVCELIRARHEWMKSDEWKQWDSANDEEYFIRKHAPKIHAKVRKALEEQAPSIWGEIIMPELYNVDIYYPDDLDEIEEEFRKEGLL